jgi:hypothetical protein
MQLFKHSNLFLLSLPVALSLSGCLGAPPNTGLQSLPTPGMYNGTAQSGYNGNGVAFGFINAQNSFGQPITILQLAMNFNNANLGMVSGTIMTSADSTSSCLSGSDLLSNNPTSLNITSAVVTLTNCQLQGNTFSANYSVYKQNSGALLDSGTLTINPNSACTAYNTTISALPNGTYNGGLQSCLNLESGILGGNITNGSAQLTSSFESNPSTGFSFESSVLAGVASADYSTSLTESVIAGESTGYVTPFYISNINISGANVMANYVSYYDYGTLQANVTGN